MTEKLLLKAVLKLVPCLWKRKVGGENLFENEHEFSSES